MQIRKVRTEIWALLLLFLIVSLLGTGIYFIKRNRLDVPFVTYSVGANNEVTVTGYNARSKDAVSKLEIPSTYNDLPVTAIADYAFSGGTIFTSITIPDSVKSIGQGAFKNCSNLTDLTLPFVGEGRTATGSKARFGYIFDYETTSSSDDSPEGTIYQFTGSGLSYHYYIPTSLRNVKITDATQVQSGAFQNCSMLNCVDLNDRITSIGKSAFSGCQNLTSLTLPFVGLKATETTASEDTLFGVLFDTEWKKYSVPTEQYYSDSESIIYYFPASLKEVTITNSQRNVTLCCGAFSGCSNLTSITIGERVATIQERAFYDCTGLTKINYNAVEVDDSTYTKTSSIFYRAGYSSSGIALTIGNEVKNIPQYLFYGENEIDAPKIKSVKVGDKIEKIGNFAFHYCSGITSLKLPDSLKTIGQSAFKFCSGITGAVSISDNVTSVGSSAFNGCTGITKATIGSGLKSINTYTFTNCSSLTEVIIANGISSISSHAFEYCSKLAKVVIPGSVKTISIFAFAECTALKDLTISDGLNRIEGFAFRNCESLTNLVLPDSVTHIAGFAFSGCSGLTSITLPFVGENPTETTASEITLFGYIFGTNYYPGASSAVQRYSEDRDEITYYIPRALKDVTIRNTKTDIKLFYGAFNWCQYLTSVTLEGNVTEIEDLAFMYCYALTTVNLGEKITAIGVSSFVNCRKLTEVTIPDSVKSIGYYAFSGCSELSRLIIGSGVTSISAYSFRFCTKLTDVIIKSRTVYVNIRSGYSYEDLIQYATTVRVLAEIDTNDNAYLAENYTRSSKQSNGYWIYTKKA